MTIEQVFHKQVIHIRANSDKVREFIKTPERINDYYPGAKDAGVLEEGKYFYCQGGSGISLFKITKDEPLHVQLRVWTARKCSKPYTVEKLQQASFFIMDEDWQLADKQGYTVLTKSWGKLIKRKLRFLPMKMIVKISAGSESNKLVDAWEEYAK